VSRGLAAAALVAAAACGAPAPVAPSPAERIAIVATERGPNGGRLVVIDERGDRYTELTEPAATAARDNSAVFSPDGRWVAFASSRGRALDETSLWIVRVAIGAVPVRLTTGPEIDLTPAWTPDGKALVFASKRAESLDLWKIGVDLGAEPPRAVGAPVQLTRAPGEELTPSVAADGRIAYTSVARDGAETVNRIEVLAPGGAVTAVTPGPFDSTPAWSPDRRTIAFSSLHLREGSDADQDIWLVDAGGGTPKVAVDVAGTFENGPVWSKDGRWIFCTSTLRKAGTAQALFASVVYVDLREKPPVVRMLVDRAGAVARLAPALAPIDLDPDRLHANPGYLDELGKILRAALQEQPQ